jgi:glyoxylase-like metal-dependent hydrolase (beta-lactamase superfamily II)
MIQIDQHGPVRKFRLARSFGKRGLYFTTAYWVDGLLIDTGCRHTVPELMKALETVPVRMIVNTHSHEDHIAGNAPLQSERRVDILAHPLALPVLADPRGKQPLNAYRKVMWGTPDSSRGKPLGDKINTENHTFLVIPTPGHSPDHICLFEPEQGWLFTGDTYVGGREKALRVDYDIWGILGSLKRLAHYPVRRLFPGSGTVRENPLPDIIKKIAYLEELAEKILTLHRQGMPIHRIRRRLLGREPLMAYLTFGHFSGYGLIRSFIVNQPLTAGRDK